jgi:hypothetical protein
MTALCLLSQSPAPSRWAQPCRTARPPDHRGRVLSRRLPLNWASMSEVGHERRIGANAPAAGRAQTADPAGGQGGFPARASKRLPHCTGYASHLPIVTLRHRHLRHRAFLGRGNWRNLEWRLASGTVPESWNAREQ